MKSEATTVNEYIDSFQGETKKVLQELREITRKTMSQYEESMKYGMPTYNLGKDVFAFAVQKNYISVYINKSELIRKHKAAIGDHNLGKNCIRYSRPGKINLSGLKNLIKEAYQT